MVCQIRINRVTKMDEKIVFIILCVLFVAEVVVGILLKHYTNKRLDEIDGFQGVVKGKDYVKNSVAVEVKGEKRAKK